MTLPAYLSAFLSLPTLALAFFCWRRRHLAVALLCLCLSLALAVEVPKLLVRQLSNPLLAQDKLIFWNSAGQIARAAVIFSILWLMLSWRPLPWPASRQRLLAAVLALIFLTFAYLRLFQLKLLAGSFEYDPGSHLLLFQLTVLGRLWVGGFCPDPTDQPELAAAELDSILFPRLATTGQMAVIVAIHPFAATEFFLFTRSTAINGFPLPPPLVVGPDAVADGLNAVWH